MNAERRPPDIVGYTLDAARERLAAAGWSAVEVVETRPPKRTLRPPQRVVRQRTGAGDRVLLVVCGEQSDEPERASSRERSAE